MQVRPLYTVPEPTMSTLWGSPSVDTARNDTSLFVDSAAVTAAAEELARVLHCMDDAVSCGQRDIQIQVKHIEQQIDEASSMSSAIDQMCVITVSPRRQSSCRMQVLVALIRKAAQNKLHLSSSFLCILQAITHCAEIQQICRDVRVMRTARLTLLCWQKLESWIIALKVGHQ